MYYPRLPASAVPMTYCTDDPACPRLIKRYNPSSRGYLVSRAAYLKRTSAMPFTRTFGHEKARERIHSQAFLPLNLQRALD